MACPVMLEHLRREKEAAAASDAHAKECLSKALLGCPILFDDDDLSNSTTDQEDVAQALKQESIFFVTTSLSISALSLLLSF